MMNIEKALAQLRHARKVGKISTEVQARMMRRLGHAGALAHGLTIKTAANVPSEHWSAMMAIRAEIEVAIAPALEAKRKAERDCLDIRYANDSKRRVAKVAPVEVAPVPVSKEVPYDCTKAWWVEQERKEREVKKAQRKACKAAGLTREQVKLAVAEMDRLGIEVADKARELIAEWGLAPA